MLQIQYSLVYVHYFLALIIALGDSSYGHHPAALSKWAALASRRASLTEVARNLDKEFEATLAGEIVLGTVKVKREIRDQQQNTEPATIGGIIQPFFAISISLRRTDNDCFLPFIVARSPSH